MTRLLDETEVVASVQGLTVLRLRAYVEARCVLPSEAAGILGFAEADVARLRLAAELSRDFDLDPEAAGLVLGLVDQIHGLRRELRALASAVEAEEPGTLDRIRGRLASGRRA